MWAAMQPQMQPPQPPPRPRLELTPFWPRDPEAWFNLSESTFDRLEITDAYHRFDLVLPALPHETIEQLRGMLRNAYTVADPYQLLKTELLQQFKPNVLEQLNKILYGPELGGQQPSQLMRTMLAALPEGEPAGLLFKHIFIHRLPADIRDGVAKKIEQLDARQLAEHADNQWFVRNAKRPHAVAAVAAAPTTAADTDELTGAVAAMSLSKGKNNRRGPKKKGGQQSAASGQQHASAAQKSFICRNHCRWGDNTWECGDPKFCTFQGNGQAGGN